MGIHHGEETVYAQCSLEASSPLVSRPAVDNCTPDFTILIRIADGFHDH